MKKSIILLLTLSLFVGGVFAHTNKTYMRPQDSSSYIPDRFRVNDFFKANNKFDALLAKVDVTAYHFHSRSVDKMGRYFGVNEESEVNLMGNRANDNMDVYDNYLIHIWDDTHSSKVTLDPKMQIAGLNASIILDLSRINKNLSFKINVPYQRIHNDIRADFSAGCAGRTIKEYLTGEYFLNVTGGANNQEALRYAKFTDQQEKIGIPFIDFCLAYNTHNEDDMVNTVKFVFISTVEKKGTAEYLFEPVLGNNNHFGINIGVEGSKRIFDGKRASLNVVWDLNYKYLFENTQVRTLGIKGASWGQYYLLGKNAVTGSLIPAANILTRNVNVKPGSQLDLNLELLFGYHASKISVGGNVVARQEEEIGFKNHFPKQTYGLAETTFVTTDQFDIVPDDVDEGYSTLGLNEKNIDLTVAQAPGMFAYKIYAQYAYDYIKRNSERMFTFAMGTSLNLTDENSHFGGYGFWLKMAAYF